MLSSEIKVGIFCHLLPGSLPSQRSLGMELVTSPRVLTWGLLALASWFGVNKPTHQPKQVGRCPCCGLVGTQDEGREEEGRERTPRWSLMDHG